MLENRHKLHLPDYAISIEEEPKNEANLPKSRARELLTTKEKEYPSKDLTPDTIMDFVRSGTPAEVTQRFIQFADRTHLFKSGGLKLFDTYNEFLAQLDNATTRESLENLKRNEVAQNRIYNEMRILSHTFQEALTEMFLEENGTDLCKLTKTYGVF